MSCTRNLVMAGIQAAINGFLLDATGNGDAKCYRDFTEMDPAKLQPGATPSVWIVEKSSSVRGDMHYDRFVRCDLEGLVMLTGTNVDEGNVQYQLDELEAALDRLLTDCDTAGGVKVAIHPDGDVMTYEGEGRGFLVYPIRVEFARQAIANP